MCCRVDAIVVPSANVGTSGGYGVYDDREPFYPALTEFVEEGDNVRFLSDIVYMDDGEIEVSVRVLCFRDLPHRRGGCYEIRRWYDVGHSWIC